MAQFSVYALVSTKKDWIYVGFTNDLHRRIIEHNSGKSKSTRPFAPFKLIYSEEVDSRAKARLREKQLKSSRGKAFLRTLL